jgi:hypothetical protein
LVCSEKRLFVRTVGSATVLAVVQKIVGSDHDKKLLTLVQEKRKLQQEVNNALEDESHADSDLQDAVDDDVIEQVKQRKKEAVKIRTKAQVKLTEANEQYDAMMQAATSSPVAAAKKSTEESLAGYLLCFLRVLEILRIHDAMEPDIPHLGLVVIPSKNEMCTMLQVAAERLQKDDVERFKESRAWNFKAFIQRKGGSNRKADQDVLASFGAGKFRVLFVVRKLLEGFDQPRVSVVCMLSEIKSTVRYAQVIGRAVRKTSSDEVKATIVTFSKYADHIKKMHANCQIPDWEAEDLIDGTDNAHRDESESESVEESQKPRKKAKPEKVGSNDSVESCSSVGDTDIDKDLARESDDDARYASTSSSKKRK